MITALPKPLFEIQSPVAGAPALTREMFRHLALMNPFQTAEWHYRWGCRPGVVRWRHCARGTRGRSTPTGCPMDAFTFDQAA